MAFYFTILTILVLSILLIIPFVETILCSKKCTFSDLQLNSSIPSNFCPSSFESNNNVKQDCKVKLIIDFPTGIVKGSFDSRNQSVLPGDALEIITIFSLNDNSIKIDIGYTCSMSDYCDIDFLRETLSSSLAKIQIESFRQTLANRLYNPTNTDSIECPNEGICPQNKSFCFVGYQHQKSKDDDQEKILNGCMNLNDEPILLYWYQEYRPHWRETLIENGEYYCNTPNCASNITIIQTFRWLSRDYILPLNFSIINVTPTTSQSTKTTTKISTTTTTTIPTTATTSNDASVLFGYFNIVFQCFVIIFFLY